MCDVIVGAEGWWSTETGWGAGVGLPSAVVSDMEKGTGNVEREELKTMTGTLIRGVKSSVL